MSGLMPTYTILDRILEGVSLLFKAKSIIEVTPASTGVNGTYMLTTCNTKWLSPKRTITIDSVDYLITEIVPNVSITIKGASLPTLKSFNIYPFFFYHGTVKATINELNKIKLSKDKLPFVYLHEVITESENYNSQDSLGMNSDAELYFMTEANIKDWTTDQHYKYAIIPMNNLKNEVVEVIRNSKLVIKQELITGQKQDHANFGIFDSSGHTQKIFNENISGCSLKLTIPFVKSSNGCCN